MVVTDEGEGAWVIVRAKGKAWWCGGMEKTPAQVVLEIPMNNPSSFSFGILYSTPKGKMETQILLLAKRAKPPQPPQNPNPNPKPKTRSHLPHLHFSKIPYSGYLSRVSLIETPTQ